jgi:hypothetical protein
MTSPGRLLADGTKKMVWNTFIVRLFTLIANFDDLSGSSSIFARETVFLRGTVCSAGTRDWVEYPNPKGTERSLGWTDFEGSAFDDPIKSKFSCSSLRVLTLTRVEMLRRGEDSSVLCRPLKLSNGKIGLRTAGFGGSGADINIQPMTCGSTAAPKPPLVVKGGIATNNAWTVVDTGDTNARKSDRVTLT